MENGLHLTQEQLQKLSENQIQSLEILSMTAQDLGELLQKESEENPFVEYHPTTNHGGAENYLNFVAAPTEVSPREIILEQLNPSKYDKAHWAMLVYIAEHVDTRGYLITSPEDIHERTKLSLSFILDCVHVIQDLQPIGIASLTLEDCLKKQLQAKGLWTDLAKEIIYSYLHDLDTLNISSLSKKLGYKKDEISFIIKEIRKLNPEPLQERPSQSSQYIIPDAIVTKTDSGYEIHVNDVWTAPYSISVYYQDMMETTQDPIIKKYFKERYERCRLLFYNIERRQKTLKSITEIIWNWQYNFFVNHDALRPMTLSHIADMVGLHTSTVSRSTKNKFVQTPSGTYSYKDLFQRPCKKGDEKACKDSICRIITQLIQSESPTAPYSDLALQRRLSETFGISLSRRLIQKYRYILHIENSYIRRLEYISH